MAALGLALASKVFRDLYNHEKFADQFALNYGYPAGGITLTKLKLNHTILQRNPLISWLALFQNCTDEINEALSASSTIKERNTFFEKSIVHSIKLEKDPIKNKELNDLLYKYYEFKRNSKNINRTGRMFADSFIIQMMVDFIGYIKSLIANLKIVNDVDEKAIMDFEDGILKDHIMPDVDPNEIRKNAEELNSMMNNIMKKYR